jgi:D-glycero-alpha-D-manno-heptose-7-phosphate kinase
MVLIYTNEQRTCDKIAKAHQNKDKTTILKLAHEAHSYLISEDIKSMGNLMYESWLEKSKLSSHISTESVDSIISTCLKAGAYGAKLLGAGGCGFILVICDPKTKRKITSIFKNNILDFNFDYSGASTMFNSSNEI